MGKTIEIIIRKLNCIKFIEYLIKYFFRDNIRKIFLKHPPYNKITHNYLLSTKDPIRYTTLALIINDIKKNNIEGCLAEVGVFRGSTSNIIHKIIPERKLYLFDTFEGFQHIDMEDKRFQDTSIKYLKKAIGNLNNIIIKKGIFPETTRGIEHETFSFVLIDLDKYNPTLDALNFFYKRISVGGYIFLHDYNSPESNYAVQKAANKFLKDKPEKLIPFPDIWGSVVIRKL